MKRLGNAFTGFVNLKYGEVGRVFQSSYRGKTIRKDVKNLQYIDAYIQVFNPFEDYPGGIGQALKEFDKAFEFAFENQFCSLGETFGKKNLGIIDRDILVKMFPNLEVYKQFAYDAFLTRNIRESLGKLAIEWMLGSDPNIPKNRKIELVFLLRFDLIWKNLIWKKEIFWYD